MHLSSLTTLLGDGWISENFRHSVGRDGGSGIRSTCSVALMQSYPAKGPSIIGERENRVYCKTQVIHPCSNMQRTQQTLLCHATSPLRGCGMIVLYFVVDLCRVTR